MTDGAASPIETELRRLISAAGPMPVWKFMSLCLSHPQHGYYVTQDPFGTDGDFTTAPEISQIFGELIGVWALSVWRMMGSPENVRLVELGPGRGTMMKDALRALRVAPDFREAISLHLVEASPLLEGMQRDMLDSQAIPAIWHRTLEDVPDGPLIVIANEFFDALPVHQAVKQSDGWHERVVGLDNAGNFAFGIAPDRMAHFERVLSRSVREAAVGDIYEWRPDAVAFDLARKVRHQGAALIIDYGPAESGIGDTLQAIGRHQYADVLKKPGRVDITAHVDFQAFGMAAESMGASVQGPVTQGDFLRNIGIELRAQALKASASAQQATDIESGVARLTQTGPTGMGELFKVMAIADPRLGKLPAFEG
jgi:NADH dehydrogenase [ubiquinone] 1 alpha subcomplex assembly factor 7